jgi:hypothetical protein
MKAMFANLTSADFRRPSQKERRATERRHVHALFDEIQRESLCRVPSKPGQRRREPIHRARCRPSGKVTRRRWRDDPSLMQFLRSL